METKHEAAAVTAMAAQVKLVAGGLVMYRCPVCKAEFPPKAMLVRIFVWAKREVTCARCMTKLKYEYWRSAITGSVALVLGFATILAYPLLTGRTMHPLAAGTTMLLFLIPAALIRYSYVPVYGLGHCRNCGNRSPESVDEVCSGCGLDLAECCTSCGYELRGLNHDRCPECGTKIRP